MKCVSGVRCAVCGSTETKPNCWRYCCAALCSARVSTSVCVCDAASAVAVAFALVGCVFWVNQMGECYHTLMCVARCVLFIMILYSLHMPEPAKRRRLTCVYAAISKTLLRSSHFVHNRRIVGCAAAAVVTIPRWFFISVPLFLFVNPKTKTIDLLLHSQTKKQQQQIHAPPIQIGFFRVLVC